MRVVPVLLSAAALSGLAWLVLSPRPETTRRRVDPEGTERWPDASPPTARPREAATGKLVVRVRTSDGSEVPPGTTAGYVRLGERRMRPPDRDGLFPFADAPVGRVEAVAEAPGYAADRVVVEVVPSVDAAEAVVTLTPVGR